MAFNNSTIYDASNLDFMLDLSYAASYVLVMLPISSIILFLGFQRCRQQAANTSVTITNSDFFTLNLAAMEVIGVVGFATAFVGFFSGFDLCRGFIIGEFPYYGEMMFPIFTCVEHYIAAVHPIMYRNLKQGRGLWIRYVSTAALWIYSVIQYIYYSDIEFFLVEISYGILFLITTVFCCISVLHVLSRSKPGARVKSRIEKSKRHAIGVIVAIMLVSFWKFLWNLIYSSFCYIAQKGFIYPERCTQMKHLVSWLSMSSNLLLPFLYLHRAGKIPRCT